MAGKVWLVLCAVVFCFKLSEGNVIVETASGKVAGVEVPSIIQDEKYYSFMGIPYGQPPLDELRFKPPVPHPKWEEVLDATKEKMHCAQFNMPIRPRKNYGFCGHEDCLHLNIHTPKLPTDQNPSLPVIVFLYTEQFKITHNGTKDYGPDFFMKEDVITVTISHRVGSLGFLSYQDDLLPGNAGIKDVILALTWIQTNIHEFGGDKLRITLMGNDAGAVIVDILLHSPKAKGLFSGAILQSGTSWSSSYFNEKEKGKLRAQRLGETLEIQYASSSLLLRELNRLDAQKISEAELHSIHADDARSIQKSILPFGPCIEHDHLDAVITKRPEDAILDINVPVMIGYNTNEGIEMSERFLRKPQYLTFADRDFTLILPIRVDFRFEVNDKFMRKAVQEIKDFYFDEGYVKVGRPGEFMKYIGDAMSFYNIDYTVRKYTETATPVYYYAFDYSGELNMRKKKVLKDAVTIEGTWGAAMGDELCYLFVCKPIRKEYIKAMADPDSDDIKVLHNMVRLWTNFAKTGNPTPPAEDNFIWTPASKENKECLVISDELEIKKNLHEDRTKFWDDFLAKYQELAVDGVVKDQKDEL